MFYVGQKNSYPLSSLISDQKHGRCSPSRRPEGPEITAGLISFRTDRRYHLASFPWQIGPACNPYANKVRDLLSKLTLTRAV